METAAEAFGWGRPLWGEEQPPPLRSLWAAGFSAPAASSPARHSGGGLPVADPLARLDLAQVGSLNAELLGLRAQEREQLGELNDRFAAYVERVRELERRHGTLRLELEALRRQERAPPRLPELYRQEARGLRALLQAAEGDKARLGAERDRLRQTCGQLRERCAQEARRRLEAEETLRRLRREASRAVLAACHAEGAAGSLAAELAFLHKLLAEERAQLAAQAQLGAAAREALEEGGPGAAKPDLAAALRDIRAQYELLAAQNRQAAEEWYRSKFAASVAELAGRNQEAVRAIRQETAEYRRLLQVRSAEIEALRGAVDSLYGQLGSLEGEQSAQVARCQVRGREGRGGAWRGRAARGRSQGHLTLAFARLALPPWSGQSDPSLGRENSGETVNKHSREFKPGQTETAFPSKRRSYLEAFRAETRGRSPWDQDRRR